MTPSTTFHFPWTPDQHQQLLALCRQYGVLQLWVFGSAAKGTFDPARSDLDFQARFPDEGDPLQLGGDMLDLLMALETLFGREVDLLTVFPIRNRYLRTEVETSRILLYDIASEEVPA
jgi:hypothetical protein